MNVDDRSNGPCQMSRTSQTRSQSATDLADNENDQHETSNEPESFLPDFDDVNTLPTPLIDICFPDADSGLYEQHIEDDTPELYPGAITTFQAVTTLLSWFAAFPGMSKASFSQLLRVLHDIILPSENNLPTTYREAIALIKMYLSPIKEYHCCINDCVIFRNSYRGNYEELSKCPCCNEDRFYPGTKVPRKRFKYLPLETRVRRLFSNSKTSQLLQSHWKSDAYNPSVAVVDDIHQSEAWNTWYGSNGVFGGEHRALTFGLCMDGLNPYAQEKTVYSTCPMSLVILNFPHHLRIKSGSLLLTGLIPGPKEPKETDPYVNVLVDDIMTLNKLTVYDGYKKENFHLKANILLHIFDYPGQNKVLHCQGWNTCIVISTSLYLFDH